MLLRRPNHQFDDDHCQPNGCNDITYGHDRMESSNREFVGKGGEVICRSLEVMAAGEVIAGRPGD